MEYLNQDELTRIMEVARQQNPMHWQLMLTAFYFGLRVSEVVNILGEDVQDGQLVVKRLKNSNRTLQPIPADGKSSDAFRLDLVERAAAVGPRGRVFPVSRQRVDQFVSGTRALPVFIAARRICTRSASTASQWRSGMPRINSGRSRRIWVTRRCLLRWFI